MDSRLEAARRICAILQKQGHRALLAGGCVRDGILGRVPKDYDIATSARAAEVEARFPHVIMVGAHFGVAMVVEPEGHFEVATFRKDGPYSDGRHPDYIEFTNERQDALRRDFTINAMFSDPVSGDILDYVGGRDDLAKGIVRAVGNPEARFREDHLRLLRAVRFAARFAYRIDSDTFAAMRALSPLAVETSAERIRDELVKMLTEGAAKRAFELLDATGILPHLLPEIEAMKGVAQPPDFHPEGDVYVHTLLLLENMGKPSPTLALGCLLHDVGKPPTQTVADRIRFYEHDRVGAEMAARICRRFRFSKAETERIVWLVKQHMRIATIPEMREAKRKRFVREAGFDELLELCRIDCLSCHGDLSIVRWIKDYRAQLSPEDTRPEPLITGADLIALGYAPGPLFKEILTAVEDAQLEGTLATHEAALDFVRVTWPN